MTGITTKQRPVYVCTNGTEYADREEAIRQQTFIDNITGIGKFLDDNYPETGPRHRKMLTHVLLKWEECKVLATDTGD